LLRDWRDIESVFVNIGGVNAPEVAMIDFEEEGRAVLASSGDQRRETDTPAMPDFVRLAARRVVSSVPAAGDGEGHFTYTSCAADLPSDIVVAMARTCHAAPGVWMHQDPIGFAAGDLSYSP
jgi:hypothetical protein